MANIRKMYQLSQGNDSIKLPKNVLVIFLDISR